VARHEDFAPLASERAQQFVREAAAARGAVLAPAAGRALVELVGVDAGRLESEVEKAALYAAGRTIEVGDIEILTWRTRSHTMFELTDAIARGDRKGMLLHLGALFDDGNEALALLGMVAWHLRRTLRGAALVESGSSSAQVARSLGLSWNVAERFTATSARLGTLGAARALRALAEADLCIKSTAEDARQTLERVLVHLVAS